MGLIPGCQDYSTIVLADVIYHINKTEKNHRIILIEEEKALDKNSIFCDKNSQQTGHRGNLLQQNKDHI